jgi:putative tricarboxylic transport membrane protein
VKKYQFCTAVLWVVFGMFAALCSYRLGIGSISRPGPGLYPFCLGVIFFIIASIILTQILIKTEAHEIEKDKKPSNFLKVIAASAVLFAYALLLEVLGYLLITFVALAVLFRIGGYKKIFPILGYSAATVIITYLVFAYLGVRFPSGVLRLLGLN